MKSPLKMTLATTLLAGMIAGSAPALAHHSFALEFDPDTHGELTGVITEVRYSNPHSRYRIDVTKEDGSVESWELQASSATSLRQQGWMQDTLKIGDKVTVEGELGRNGVHKLFIRGGILTASNTPFGNKVERTGEPRDRNKVYADPYTNYGHGQINPDFPFDISGPWRNTYKFHLTVDDLDPKPTPYTEEGRRLRAANEKYDDPALRCIALGLPRLFGNPYNLDIYDVGDQYLFLYVEHNAVRHIWMDGRTIPADARPTSYGYSVGHWEEEPSAGKQTLVIETDHLLPGWLDGSGLPMSGEGTHTVERYVFSEDRLSVDRTMTIYDPLYTQPLIRTRGMAREDNLDVTEQDSCDPTSYFTDIREAGLLDKYLKP